MRLEIVLFGLRRHLQSGKLYQLETCGHLREEQCVWRFSYWGSSFSFRLRQGRKDQLGLARAADQGPDSVPQGNTIVTRGRSPSAINITATICSAPHSILTA